MIGVQSNSKAAHPFSYNAFNMCIAYVQLNFVFQMQTFTIIKFFFKFTLTLTIQFLSSFVYKISFFKHYLKNLVSQKQIIIFKYKTNTIQNKNNSNTIDNEIKY